MLIFFFINKFHYYHGRVGYIYKSTKYQGVYKRLLAKNGSESGGVEVFIVVLLHDVLDYESFLE